MPDRMLHFEWGRGFPDVKAGRGPGPGRGITGAARQYDQTMAAVLLGAGVAT